MTWFWATAGASSPEDVVEARFIEQDDGGSRVALTHHVALPGEDTTNLEHGWDDVLSRLLG